MSSLAAEAPARDRRSTPPVTVRAGRRPVPGRPTTNALEGWWTLRSYTAAVRDYPHTTAVKTGRRVPTNCQVEFVDIEPIHRAFAPMVRELRYDFSELALVTYLQARAAGKQISALPLVLHGNFHHRSISRLATSAVQDPKDLVGKRVGVRSYTQTTGLWVRGVLAEEHGVDADDITWVTTEGPHVAEYVEPGNVERTSGPLLDLLRAGDIAALLIGPKAVPEGAGLTPLLPDWQTAEKAWYDKHSTVPINHLLTVRTDVLRDDPAAVRGLYDAFAAEIDARGDTGPKKVSHGLDDTLLGSVRLAVRYAAQQHLISDEPTAEEIFADFHQYLDPR
jgi:4,5-dihydroxyphthalate decarboxylase